MKKAILLFFLGIIVFGCSQLTEQKVNNEESSTPKDAQRPKPFPDFGYMVDTSLYQGPVFHLSQDYPDTLPGDLPSFLSIDFKKDWRTYLEKVQDYCFEGNTEIDFRVEHNSARKWYHMPWQHWGSSGREGFHGLTQEAPVKKFQLAATQTDSTTGAVAIGFYNDIAGYTIGQMWKDHYRPVHDTDISFRHGAVLFKLLFVTFSDSVKATQQVPSLTNGIWWDGFVVSDFTKMSQPNPAIYRHTSKVVLIQMDIMVRDTTAPHGWVFGNFQYNGNMNRPDKWKNLVPVGVMWDEDPQDSTNRSNAAPKRTIINTALKGTIINPDSTELPPTHLGWNGRLNGPVDNPMSSCYSCHATAEYPQLAIMTPLFNKDTLRNNPVGSPGWMRWFQNLACGKPFDKDARSMDFSYQLALSIQNFDQWKLVQGGIFDTIYRQKPPAFIKRELAHAAAKKVESKAATFSEQVAARRVVPIQFIEQ